MEWKGKYWFIYQRDKQIIGIHYDIYHNPKQIEDKGFQ